MIDGAVGSVAAPGSSVGQPAARASWGRDAERRVHPRAVARSAGFRTGGVGLVLAWEGLGANGRASGAFARQAFEALASCPMRCGYDRPGRDDKSASSPAFRVPTPRDAGEPAHTRIITGFRGVPRLLFLMVRAMPPAERSARGVFGVSP